MPTKLSKCKKHIIDCFSFVVQKDIGYDLRL